MITASHDLLIGQWRNAVHLQAFLDLFIRVANEELIDPAARLAVMRRIETAEGVWLDYLGKRMGVERPWAQQAAIDPRFGFDDAGFGFDLYPFEGGAENAQTFPLGDVPYRRFLKARGVTLVARGTFPEFMRACKHIDPASIIRDNYDMSVTVSTAVAWQFQLADKAGCLPRTAGVRIDYLDTRKFGFDAAGVPFDQGPFE